VADIRGRARLVPSPSAAFAPAAITNFFSIEYDARGHLIGASGGGYILSKGTVTEAQQVRGAKARVTTTVNGDASYDARTTRKAVTLLLEDIGSDRHLRIDQEVQTPVGGGFGSSGASATSAVYAAASALRVKRSKRELALYSHRAELTQQTGLGTVSVIYDNLGAGAITKAGEPGVAKFTRVKVPKSIKLVTGFLAPFTKRDAFSSAQLSGKINRLGRDALLALISDPSLDTLGTEGETFSRRLGLETPEVKKLITGAKSKGALYASQNMIGYAVHSIVPNDDSARVATAFRKFGEGVRVDVFEIGDRKAGLIPSRKRLGPS
jgi:pantoate kinase